MINIGVVNIDTSHPLVFAQCLAEMGNRARYAAVYNDAFRADDEVSAFISKHGLEPRCESIEELADITDVGFIQSCNWSKHIEQAMPFIERGKPVFIDKPIAGSLHDCRKLEELDAGGAVILGCSSVRYADEIVAFAAQPEEEVGRILNVFGTAGVDEFNYAIHVVEAIGGLMGSGAESCKFVGRSSIDGRRICETFFVRFDTGITATYNTFQGVWQPFEVVIQTTKSTYQFRVDVTKIYAALLDRICDFMETGNNRLAPVAHITESVEVMLAGRISRANGGAEVKLADIPENDPGYDGGEFERQYAATASKIYL